MKLIFDYFMRLVSIFEVFWNFVLTFFENMIMLFKYILHSMALATQCILSMPTWLQVFATLTLSVSVLYLIVGRQGGKSE